MGPTHHPLVAAHPLRAVDRPAGFDVGFLGTLTRRAFVAGTASAFAPYDAPTFTPERPAFDEEYFEWIDLLEAVAAAEEQFVFAELGAGYGRWSVRAILAARARGLRTTCIAVEAEPRHCQWMREHVRDNGEQPADHDLIWAAVAARPGFVPFKVGESDRWYGQSIAKRSRTDFPDVRGRRRLKIRALLGRPPALTSDSRTSVWVPGVTLAELLAAYPRVDLIDVDVQGREGEALAPAIDLLTARVRRVHVGTHGAAVEAELRSLFASHGWRAVRDYACGTHAETPYGPITFGDGVQTWTNPTLEEK